MIPTTKRFCVVCRDNKEFVYDRVIGHSCCIDCGSRFGRKAIPDQAFEDRARELKQAYRGIIEDQKTMIKHLRKEINKLKKIKENNIEENNTL